MSKFKRSPCNLGWTDHAFRRLRYRIKNDIPEPYKHRRKRRLISKLREVLFHKASSDLPF
jgi:hypothetical protein